MLRFYFTAQKYAVHSFSLTAYINNAFSDTTTEIFFLKLLVCFLENNYSFDKNLSEL